MERGDVIAGIERALADVLQRDMPALAEDVRLFDDLNMDSTTALELLMTLEDTIGVEIDAENLSMDDFQTIGTLADYLMDVAKIIA
jgi:acyl carrier protein